uniref:Uncharacterized protein n=1 Tax=Panagrolaimus davidi TaxID=227884 RepID=A0A914QN93_9BILA
MATKSADCLLPEIHQNPSILNNNSQFNNLNLNENENFKIDFVGSKIKSSKNIKVQYKDLNNFDQQSKKISLYSFDNNQLQSVTSEYLNGFQNEEKNWKKGSGSNDTSSDTLSLYISAVENVKTNNLGDQSLTYQNQNSGKTLKDLKHEFYNVGLTNGMFEIPRQQKDETKEPENMQFKSSQKLINPNQSKFEQLKEKANKLFQEEKYNEAIKAYTEILALSSLSPENRATIYSNRSASYLLVGNSLNSAKIDAEKAIKLWPSWWKGYYRLARVYVVQQQWIKAETNLQKALALNSESKEIRDELSFVRSQ